MSHSGSLRSRSGCSPSISSTRHRSRWHSASLCDFPIVLILLCLLPLASGCRLILSPDHIAQPVSDHVCAHPDRPQNPLQLPSLDRRNRDAPTAHHLRPGKKTIINWIHVRPAIRHCITTVNDTYDIFAILSESLSVNASRYSCKADIMTIPT
jgi:hypothetical protein